MSYHFLLGLLGIQTSAGLGPPQCLGTAFVLWGKTMEFVLLPLAFAATHHSYSGLFSQEPFLPGDRTAEHKEAISEALSLAIMLESQRFNYCVRAIPLKEKSQRSHHWRGFSAKTGDSRNVKELRAQHSCASHLQTLV